MLEISRSDVPSDYIIPSGQFIRLPIEKYMNELHEMAPIPSQIALINAVNRYRFVVAALSRRQGKTFIANIIGHLVALVPGSNVLIMSPNYSLSQISFELQRHFFKVEGIKPEKDNAKDKVIELENGSTIRMGSVNQVDSCVGRSYDLIIFDEAALTNGMDAFNVALRPTLDRPNSRALFISTPRGKTNWFSELYRRGWDETPEGAAKAFPQWCSIRATWQANPRMSEADVAEAKSTMSEAEFAQEYLADFNQYEGQIWRLPESSVQDFNPEEHRFDVVAGLDVGFKDATAMCVVGYAYEEDKYYFLDEYWDRGKTTSTHASEMHKLIERWNIDYIYIDSAAAQTRFDLARDYDIPTILADKSLLDGIGFVGNLAENEKLVIKPELRQTLIAFDAYRWDPNPNLVREKPIHDEASHMADAIRYALYSFKSAGMTL